MKNCYAVEFDYSFTGDKSAKKQSEIVKKTRGELSVNFANVLKNKGFKRTAHCVAVASASSLSIFEVHQAINEAFLVLEKQDENAAIAKLNIILRKQGC